MKFSTFWLKIGHQKSRIFGIALFGWKKSNPNEPNLNLNIRISELFNSWLENGGRKKCPISGHTIVP